MHVDLDTLYRTLSPMLLRRAQSILGDPMEAEDAVHEAFTLGNALETLAAVPTPTEAARLLWSRCIGRCLTRLRAGRRRSHYERHAAASWHASRGLGSAARLQLRLDAGHVYLEALVGMAPPEDAMVVFMMAWAGMTQSEAAAALPDDPRTPQALGQAYRRWMARLAERFPELADEAGGPGESDG